MGFPGYDAHVPPSAAMSSSSGVRMGSVRSGKRLCALERHRLAVERQRPLAGLGAQHLEPARLVDIAFADRDPLEIGRDTSELQSLMRISYAVFCLKKKK